MKLFTLSNLLLLRAELRIGIGFRFKINKKRNFFPFTGKCASLGNSRINVAGAKKNK